MRIGSRQVNSSERPTLQQTANPAAFGSGVGTALQTLGSVLAERHQFNVSQEVAAKRESERLAKEARARAEAQRNTDIATNWIRTQGEADRALMESRANVDPGAPGYTEQVNELLDQTFADFSARLDLTPQEQEKYKKSFETYRQNALTSAFTFEFEESNNHTVTQIGEAVDTMQTDLRTNPSLMETRLAEAWQLIEDSALPPRVKVDLKSQVKGQFANVTLGAELDIALRDLAPAQEPKADDVVAPGAGTAQRALAITTASVESSGFGNPYTVIYGGSHTDSFVDHPRKYVTITSGPNKGKKSSAAGKYQFLASTWDANVREMKAQGYDFGPEEFSPVNQDRVFWHYAKKRYRNAARDMGMQGEAINLEAAIMSGDPIRLAQVRAILAGETGHGVVWEGLQHMTDEQFAESIRTGKMRGPLGSSQNPDVWNDPRFAGLSFEQKQKAFELTVEAEETRMEQIAQSLQEQRDQLMEQLRQSAFNNELSSSAIPDLAERFDLTVDEQKKLQTEIDQASIRKANAATVIETLASGQTLVPSQHSEGLSELMRLNGITEGLAQQDAEAATAAMPTWTRAGFMPEDQRDIFAAQLSSADPNVQAFAYSTLAQLARNNPNILSSSKFSKEQQANVDFYARNRQFFPTSTTGDLQLLEQIKQAKDRIAGQPLSQLRKEAGEQFDTEFKTGESLTQLWDGWLTRQPTMPTTQSQRTLFTSDMRQAYIQGYVRTGDPAQAKSYMETWAKETWGVSEISGTPTMMKYPPEKTWRDGFTPETFGLAIDELNAELGLAEGETVILVADKVTEADIAAREAGTRSELPRYQVIVKDANGIITQAGQHFYPTPIAPRQVEQAQLRGRAAQAEEAAQAARQTVLQLEEAVVFAGSKVEKEELEARLQEARSVLEQSEGTLEEAEGQIASYSDPVELGKMFYEQIDPENLGRLSRPRIDSILSYLMRVERNSLPMPEGTNLLEVRRLIQDLRKER